MMRPRVSPDEMWIEYLSPDGEVERRMPVVVASKCPPRLREPGTLCVRCPHCGKIHQHGAEEGTHLSHCSSPREPQDYYMRLACSFGGEYLPWGWFPSTDGPWPRRYARTVSHL